MSCFKLNPFFSTIGAVSLSFISAAPCDTAGAHLAGLPKNVPYRHLVRLRGAAVLNT